MTFCDNPKCMHHVEVPEVVHHLSARNFHTGDLYTVGYHTYRFSHRGWLQLCDQCKSAIDFMSEAKAKNMGMAVKANTGLSGGTPSAAAVRKGGES